MSTNATEPRYVMENSTNRNTVWIHDATDGSTVGRFGRMGVDIHNSASEIMDGAPECRLCTHGFVTNAEWQLFREKAKEFWDLDIPDDYFDHNIFTLNEKAMNGHFPSGAKSTEDYTSGDMSL